MGNSDSTHTHPSVADKVEDQRLPFPEVVPPFLRTPTSLLAFGSLSSCLAVLVVVVGAATCLAPLEGLRQFLQAEGWASVLPPDRIHDGRVPSRTRGTRVRRSETEEWTCTLLLRVLKSLSRYPRRQPLRSFICGRSLGRRFVVLYHIGPTHHSTQSCCVRTTAPETCANNILETSPV